MAETHLVCPPSPQPNLGTLAQADGRMTELWTSQAEVDTQMKAVLKALDECRVGYAQLLLVGSPYMLQAVNPRRLDFGHVRQIVSSIEGEGWRPYSPETVIAVGIRRQWIADGSTSLTLTTDPPAMVWAVPPTEASPVLFNGQHRIEAATRRVLPLAARSSKLSRAIAKDPNGDGAAEAGEALAKVRDEITRLSYWGVVVYDLGASGNSVRILHVTHSSVDYPDAIEKSTESLRIWHMLSANATPTNKADSAQQKLALLLKLLRPLPKEAQDQSIANMKMQKNKEYMLYVFLQRWPRELMLALYKYAAFSSCTAITKAMLEEWKNSFGTVSTIHDVPHGPLRLTCRTGHRCPSLDANACLGRSVFASDASGIQREICARDLPDHDFRAPEGRGAS